MLGLWGYGAMGLWDSGVLGGGEGKVGDLLAGLALQRVARLKGFGCGVNFIAHRAGNQASHAP